MRLSVTMGGAWAQQHGEYMKMYEQALEYPGFHTPELVLKLEENIAHSAEWYKFWAVQD